MVLRSGSFCVSPRALFLSLAPFDGSVEPVEKLVALEKQTLFVFCQRDDVNFRKLHE